MRAALGALIAPLLFLGLIFLGLTAFGMSVTLSSARHRSVIPGMTTAATASGVWPFDGRPLLY